MIDYPALVYVIAVVTQDEPVFHAESWHEQVPEGTTIRAEDIVLYTFVALRRIATETVDAFKLNKVASAAGGLDTAANCEIPLKCDAKLSQWLEKWGTR